MRAYHKYDNHDNQINLSAILLMRVTILCEQRSRDPQQNLFKGIDAPRSTVASYSLMKPQTWPSARLSCKKKNICSVTERLQVQTLLPQETKKCILVALNNYVMWLSGVAYQSVCIHVKRTYFHTSKPQLMSTSKGCCTVWTYNIHLGCSIMHVYGNYKA